MDKSGFNVLSQKGDTLYCSLRVSTLGFAEMMASSTSRSALVDYADVARAADGAMMCRYRKGDRIDPDTVKLENNN